jgi:L-rhamnose mutarotase
MKKFTLILDLKPDEGLIKEYEKYHESIPIEIEKSIRNSGIQSMEISRFSNRLVMNIETDDNFSFENKGQMDKVNPFVQEWEKLMWKFQDSIPGAEKDEKWVLTKKIFDLNK